MALSRGPILLYVLPLVAVFVLVASIFVVGGSDDIRSAVVLGGPTDTDEPFRGRIQVSGETLGTAMILPGEEITLTATQGGHQVVRRLTTDETGWVEFALPLKRAPAFDLRVTDRLGNVLAEGSPQLETKRWSASARRRGGEGARHTSGVLAARIDLPDRVLAVPFQSRGVITAWRGEDLLPGARITLGGSGLELFGVTLGMTNDAGQFDFKVRPDEHIASLVVEVQDGEDTFRFDQLLPIIPGAFGLRREKDSYRILSPIPREEAWFTFVREHARLAGGRVPLLENKSGGAEGVIPASLVPSGAGLFLVLASSADGRSPSTVGYPLDGQARTFDAWDAYLLDGAPLARALVEARRRKVRWSLGAYAGLAGLLTLLLFIARVRGENNELVARLSEVGATKDTSEHSSLPLVIAVVCLFFAFSLGVLWIVAR